MRRLRDGDAETRFTALYRDTAQDILAFLLRRCATPEDAADCLAETYAIAWDKRERAPGGSDARPWLFGVARNVMRRARERDGRADLITRQLASALADAKPTAESPDQNRDDPDDRVLDALTELSAIDREIITLIVWDGLNPTDIAAVLQMSPNLVRVRAHRARAKLRAILAAGSSPPRRARPGRSPARRPVSRLQPAHPVRLTQARTLSSRSTGLKVPLARIWRRTPSLPLRQPVELIRQRSGQIRCRDEAAARSRRDGL